jgi:hypothetical protein
MPNQKNPPPLPDDPEQSRRFEVAARELGADESGKAFKRALSAVVPRKRKATRAKTSK